MTKLRDSSSNRLFPGPPFDRPFYEALRRARLQFKPVDSFVVSLAERGRAFVVQKGHAVRIICLKAAQVTDVCIWNAHDRGERFWNDETLNQQGVHVSSFDRLWSNMPKYRPMMTIIEDTVENKPTFPGANHHILLGAHCNPHQWYWSLGNKTHPCVTKYNCYHNLVRAIAAFGLQPEDLHDNINLFQKSRIDLETGKCISEPSDAKKGDYVELYAEIDVLVAVSICSMGSGTYAPSVGEQDVTPIGIEIFDTGIPPLPFEDILDI